MRSSLIVPFAAALLVPAIATAQQGAATARISKEVVEVGARFQYQADASVRGGQALEVVKAPNFGNLRVVGQQQMPQIITVNGVTERRLSIRYAVVASDEGTFEIKPPTFQVADKEIVANPVTVTVVKKGSAKADAKPAAKRDSRYFIDATIEPSDRKPYVGEQLTLKYDLYVDGAQMEVQPANSREPSLDEFWIQELTDRVARTDQMVSVNGRLYKRSSMWSYALFPLHAGPVEIEPATVELVVGGLFRRGQPATLVSDAVPLDVQPLPPNAPDGFYEGNVGQWNFKVSTDQSATKVGRAFVVELRATGSGQVSRVQLPKLPPIAKTRLSDTDEASSPQFRGTTVGGTTTVKYTLTPVAEGKITIPPLEFSWFDPQRGTYQTSRSDSLVVNVAPGAVGAELLEPQRAVRRNVAADEDLIANLVLELEPPREPPSMTAAPDPARFPWPYWLLISASFLGFLGVTFGARVRALARRAAPEREQRNRGAEALDALDAAGSDAGALSRAVSEGLNRAFDVPRGSVTASDIEAAFAKRDLDLEAARELSKVLAECEAARFAPSGQTLSSSTVKRARAALQRLVATLAVLMAVAGTARAQEATTLANPDVVDVQYNAGTAAAKAGDYATARLALERATYLSPWDSQVEANRALVERIVRLNTIERSRTGRTMEGDETLFWWTIASHINPHLLGFAASFMWLLAAFAVAFRRKTPSPAVRDAAAVGLILAIMLGVALSFGAVARSQILRTARPIIVMTDDLSLREGPNAAAKLKRTPPALVPGTMLRITDERGDWVKIAWPGDTGWTLSDSVAPIN